MATVFVGVESGLNHLIRPMMYDSYHDMVNISNINGTKRIYTIVGYICETDTFGLDRKLDEVHEGDIIAIKNRTLVFFEVKMRSKIAFGYPEEFVSEAQELRILDASTFKFLIEVTSIN